jgi:hypothetical protein
MGKLLALAGCAVLCIVAIKLIATATPLGLVAGGGILFGVGRVFS